MSDPELPQRRRLGDGSDALFDQAAEVSRVYCRPKGLAPKTLEVYSSALILLRKWRERQARELEGSPGHVFTTLDGKAVSPRCVQQMVKRYAQKGGITKDPHPHSLRHSFATDFLRETRKAREVQKALSHANLATTQIYTHIVDEELGEALKSFRQLQEVAA